MFRLILLLKLLLRLLLLLLLPFYYFSSSPRSLQNMTNLFIVSLAVADLCVAGVVMPFYAYIMVTTCLLHS